MRNFDDNIRSLQRAVDAIDVAQGAFKEFMEEQEGNRWYKDFLDAVCDAQNAIIRLQNQVGWDDIEDVADRIPRPGDGKE